MATDYSNDGGSGDRQLIITVSFSSDLPRSGGSTELIDGANDNTLYFNVNSTVTGRFIRFDFGATASKIIDEIKWKQDTTSQHGEWIIQGSNDLSSWSNIGSTFILGGSSEQVISAIATNVSGYRSYQFLGLSGRTTNAPYLYEVEFKIDNFVSTSSTGGGGASVAGMFFCHG